MTEEFLVGVEIGGTKLQAVIGDSLGNIFTTVEVAADSAGGRIAILGQLEKMIYELLSAGDRSVAGLGIGFGGPVDTSRGVVIKSNHVAGWENVSLIDWAAKKFQLPCTIGNDTDVAAIAEARVGGGKQDQSVFYTNIGSGIGGGLVVDGQLYERPYGAMEVGHSRVYSKLDQEDGILEDFCSGWSLSRRAQEAANRDKSSLMWRLSGNNLRRIDAVSLFDAWERNDKAATRVVDCFLDCYAGTMSNVIALLNPDVIIIGGGVAQRGMPLLDAIRTRIGRMVYEPFANSYRIELTALQEKAVTVGALLIAGASGYHDSKGS